MVPVTDLMKVTGLSFKQVEQVLTNAASAWRSPPLTALQMKLSLSVHCLSLGCPLMDELLKGGLPVGGVTELYGQSGAGKTQIALQLCVSVQYPQDQGGLDSGAVFICTEDSFPVKRLQQLIGEQHRLRPQLTALTSQINFSDNVYIEHAADLASLRLCLSQRVPLLVARGLVRLLVLDSIAALFRSEFQASDWMERNKQLISFSSKIKDLSQQFNLVVLCINQVTDVMDQSGGSSGPSPSLGLCWSNSVMVRLRLTRLPQWVSEGGQHSALRRLEVEFSPHLPPHSLPVAVWRGGVRGLQ
ncbi:DNA repair protein XRCC3 isoform X2 [Gouania willdenowi]|nr:DNA repair protein XRCC3 isoform X2 [Gouania willdenowi]